VSSRDASGLTSAACRAGLAGLQRASMPAGPAVFLRPAWLSASQAAITGSGSPRRACSMMSAMVTPKATTGANCRSCPCTGLASALMPGSPPGRPGALCRAPSSSKTATAAAGGAAGPCRAELAARATAWMSSGYCCGAAISAGWPCEASSVAMRASMCCWARSTCPPAGSAMAAVSAGSLPQDMTPPRPRGGRSGGSGRPVRSQRPGRRGCPVRVRRCRRPQSGQVSASSSWQPVQAKVHGIRQVSIHRPPLAARHRGQYRDPIGCRHQRGVRGSPGAAVTAASPVPSYRASVMLARVAAGIPVTVLSAARSGSSSW